MKEVSIIKKQCVDINWLTTGHSTVYSVNTIFLLCSMTIRYSARCTMINKPNMFLIILFFAFIWIITENTNPHQSAWQEGNAVQWALSLLKLNPASLLKSSFLFCGLFDDTVTLDIFVRPSGLLVHEYWWTVRLWLSAHFPSTL